MKKHAYTIRTIKPISDGIICLDLVPKDLKQVISFRSGQYGLISFLRGNVISQERPFSFASSPTDAPALQFGFKIFGQFTSELASLQKGDAVFIRGPYGSLVFDEWKHRDVVFLSAGIGITPFMSMLRYASASNLPNTLTLLYSNKTISGTPYFEEIKDLTRRNQNFKAIFAFTHEPAGDAQEYVTGRINATVVSNAVCAEINRKTFFICGPEAFTASMLDILKKFGVRDSHIKTEGFTLAPRSFFGKETWAFPFPLVAGASALAMLMVTYGVYNMEQTKALLKTADVTSAYAVNLSKMSELNQIVIDHSNTLLADQQKNTQTVSVLVPQITERQVTTTPSTVAQAIPRVTAPPRAQPVVQPPKTTTPVTKPVPKPVPAPTPAPAAPAPVKPTPAPAPKPVPVPKPTPTPRTTVS